MLETPVGGVGADRHLQPGSFHRAVIIYLDEEKEGCLIIDIGISILPMQHRHTTLALSFGIRRWRLILTLNIDIQHWR